MDRESIYREIKEYLVHSFDVPEEIIAPEADLVDELNLDSIDAIDLMVRLQEITGRRVEADDFKNLRTINDVLNLVQQLHAPD